MISGGTPATDSCGSGRSACAVALHRASDISSTAPAPSDIELLPAVTEPRAANTGFNLRGSPGGIGARAFVGVADLPITRTAPPRPL
jgi:hypothetical protein